MKSSLSVAMLVVFTALTVQTAAGQSDLPTRFVDQETAVVLHVDLDQAHLAAGAEQPLSLVGATEAQRKTLQPLWQEAERTVQRLREMGIKHAYLVANATDFRQPQPLLVFTPANRDVADALPGQAKQQLKIQACEVIGSAVVCGSAAQLRRLKMDQRESAEHWSEAGAALKDAPMRVVIVPSEAQRRALREMLPRLGEEFAGISGQELARGVRWITAGLRLEPEPNFNIVVQSQDAASARRLQSAIEAGLRSLARRPEVQKELPMVAQLLQRLQPELEADQLRVSLGVEGEDAQQLRDLLAIAVGAAGENVRRERCMQHLKQLGLAMHNFHDAYGSFPPSASYDAQGKPLLSWRVFLLPYIDQQELYEQFRLDEPWDSAHNRKLIEKMPEAFACDHPELNRQGKTTILAPLGENTIFSGNEGVRFQEITDGTSNTILLVEALPEQAVVWTRPSDWEVDLNEPKKGLVKEGTKDVLALFADGSVRVLESQIKPETLRRYLERNDGKVIER